jgi:hypothetical protein
MGPEEFKGIIDHEDTNEEAGGGYGVKGDTPGKHLLEVWTDPIGIHTLTQITESMGIARVLHKERRRWVLISIVNYKGSPGESRESIVNHQ